MAVNHPKQSLRKVTLEDVDMTYAEDQYRIITDLLRNGTHKFLCREKQALDGVRNLLKAMIGESPAAKVKATRTIRGRVTPDDVNRIRDLVMAGKSHAGIAKQMNLRPLAVQRLARGETYIDVPYTPSEFFLPDFTKHAGTNRFPWTEKWKVYKP